jgi:hypothetical protein
LLIESPILLLTPEPCIFNRWLSVTVEPPIFKNEPVKFKLALSLNNPLAPANVTRPLVSPAFVIDVEVNVVIFPVVMLAVAIVAVPVTDNVATFAVVTFAVVTLILLIVTLPLHQSLTQD